MQPEKDQVRIAHMREAATRAITFSVGRSREDLDHDDMLVLALTKLVEIVGEAAKHVGAETRSRFPGVPWWLDLRALCQALLPPNTIQRIRYFTAKVNGHADPQQPHPIISRTLQRTRPSFTKQIRRGVLAASQFPEKLSDATGPITKPATW
ncbi:MAG: HepT-like ribonuclease domain-containing protein [Pseudonocardiales bacterium]